MKCEMCNKEKAHGTLIDEYHTGGPVEWAAACCDCGKEAQRKSVLAQEKYGRYAIRNQYFDERFTSHSTEAWNVFDFKFHKAMGWKKETARSHY